MRFRKQALAAAAVVSMTGAFGSAAGAKDNGPQLASIETTSDAATQAAEPKKPARVLTGVATWYQHGKRTANGERFNPDGLTAAHRTLPFGTRVLVKHRATGRSVTVRINDRGPFTKGKMIDLSRGAARAIGLTGTGAVELLIAAND